MFPGRDRCAAERGRGAFKFALDGAGGAFAAVAAAEPVTLIRLCGDLAHEAGFGVFAPRPARWLATPRPPLPARRAARRPARPTAVTR